MSYREEADAEPKRQISSREVAKAANKAKQEKAAADDATGKGHAPKAKPLSKAQRGKLVKLSPLT